MANDKSVNYIVAAFVFLIIGVVLLSSIAVETNAKTSRTILEDESKDLVALDCVIGGAVGGEVNETSTNCNVSVTHAPTGWKTYDCGLTNVVVRNGTAGHTFTLNTDYYLFADTGVVQMVNNTGAGGNNGSANTTVFDYDYCPDDYLNSTFGRSVLNTVPGFFALALLGVALWLFYMVFRENKII